MNLKLGKWSGEFILIVLGVLAALAVEDWRQQLNDEELERHFIEGVKSDLQSDLIDLESALIASAKRTIAADDLMFLLDDSSAGKVFGEVVGIDIGELFSEIRGQNPIGAIQPGKALMSMGDMQIFDSAQTTISEATSSGTFGVIRDIELRTAIANYYVYSNRWGSTTDERVDANGMQFRQVLAESGLTLGVESTDELVLEAFQNNARLIAELRGFRQFAVRQQGFHTRLANEANGLLKKLDEWLTENT